MPRRLVLLDGYVDEPACFGVPPYISPHARTVAGALEPAGWRVDYLTIDQWRRDPAQRTRLQGADVLALVSGALVPGKYLRGMPVSYREARGIAGSFEGETVLGGSSAVWGFGQGGGKAPAGRHELQHVFQHLAFQDLAAYLHDWLVLGSPRSQRRMTMDEWGRWSAAGASIVRQHPDWPRPLIAELETYHGCVRYVDGGCAFCMEPAEGGPKFRPVEHVVAEVEALARNGVVNFRIGGQADFFSYHARGVGDGPEPRPDPEAIEALLKGIRKAAPALEWLHIDNVDPGILARWPAESEQVARLVAEHCTDGNIAAFGVETVDPAVIERNHLKCPEEVAMQAIRLLNKVGAERGPRGLPRFLPGLNFVCGLPGETRGSYATNQRFLARVRDEGLLVRRINIRKLLEQRVAGGADEGAFHRFKEWVRREVDQPMLRRIAPEGTVLRGVWMEHREGHTTFGRQPASYALLVGVPYDLPLERPVDVMVTSHGFRSLTGVQVPFPVNQASLRAMQALPGVGAKRAARLVRRRPFAGPEQVRGALDDPQVAERVLPLLAYEATPTPAAARP